jgi:hypothetical protein
MNLMTNLSMQKRSSTRLATSIATPFKRHFCTSIALSLAVLLVGCAAPPKPVDYTAFKQSRPRSIVVLPPINNTTDIAASNSVLAQSTRPLAESGYYVLPVTLVAETFKENGLTQPTDMHEAPIAKLRQIFGADAAMYITVTKFGTSYKVISSASEVNAEAKLVDLKTGVVLWTGQARASSEEGQNQQQGGLLGAVITALVKQVLASTTEQNYRIAGVAADRLLGAHPNGILVGPRSPNYGKD